MTGRISKRKESTWWKGANKNNGKLFHDNFLFVIFGVCKQKSWQASRKPVVIFRVQFSPSSPKDRVFLHGRENPWKIHTRPFEVIADRTRNFYLIHWLYPTRWGFLLSSTNCMRRSIIDFKLTGKKLENHVFANDIPYKYDTSRTIYFTYNVYVMYFLKVRGDERGKRTEKRGKLQNQVKREKSSGHHRPSGSTSRQA